ncbi:MAG: dienelactone hydrolase family protein [Actinomycetes bacterium]
MRNTTIEINGEDVPGIIALPASGSGPGVIVIQEWWGLVAHVQHLVQRLADEGFVALAVDHYRGAETTEPDEAQKLMLGLDIARVADDLAAAAAHLAARDDVEGDSVAVVGFCMGGGLALLAPTVSDAICCTTAFYPAMPWPQYAPDWSQYRGKGAMIHKAESDEEWAGPAITEYSAAISAAGGAVEVIEYPGSVHAFFNDARPEVYQADNAQLAWERTLSFLRGCSG